MWSLYPGQPSTLLRSAITFILEYLSAGDRLQLLSLGPINLLPHLEPEKGCQGLSVKGQVILLPLAFCVHPVLFKGCNEVNCPLTHYS